MLQTTDVKLGTAPDAIWHLMHQSLGQALLRLSLMASSSTTGATLLTAGQVADQSSRARSCSKCLPETVSHRQR
jgi:hypothetical protein